MLYECKRWNLHGSSYIKFPVRLINKGLRIDRNLNFCLDTGSPFNCIISYHQSVGLKIPFEELPRADGTIVIGGTRWESYVLDGCDFVLRSDTGKLRTVEVGSLFVLGPPISQTSGLPVPGILGLPFIERFTLVAERKDLGGRIYLTDEKVRTEEL